MDGLEVNFDGGNLTVWTVWKYILTKAGLRFGYGLVLRFSYGLPLAGPSPGPLQPKVILGELAPGLTVWPKA